MNLFYSLFLSFLLFFAWSKAKTQSVHWGTSFPLGKEAAGAFHLLSSSADHYQLLFASKRGPASLLTHNHKHLLQHNHAYELASGYAPLIFEGKFAFGADTLAFFRHPLKENNRQLILQANIKQGELNDWTPLFSFEKPINQNISPVSIDKYYNIGPTSPWYHSPDGSKLAYVQGLSKRTVNSQSQFVVAVMDRDRALLWQRTVSLDGLAEYITAEDVAVSDEGEVLLLTQLHSSSDFAAKIGQPYVEGYRCELIRFTEQGQEHVDVYLDAPVVPMAACLRNGKGSEVFITGIYDDQRTAFGADGVFVKRLELGNKRFSDTTYPFTSFPQVMAVGELHTSWQNRLVLRDAYTLANGKFGFVLEVVQPYTTHPGNTSSSLIAKQLIIPQFSGEGQLQHITALDRQLITSDPQNIAFGLGVEGNRLHLLYNVSGRFLPEGLRAEGVKRNGIYTLQSTLEESGIWSQSSIVTTAHSTGYNILPRRSIYAAGQWLLMARDRRSIRVGSFAVH